MLQRVFELDIELVRHQLRDLVHFAVRHVERAARIFQHGLCRHRAERDDLRDVFLAVLLPDVVDHFAAPAHAEIDVDIGHRNALGIQEPLEEQDRIAADRRR